MPTGTHVDIAEREALDNKKVARLAFIVLLLLIVMATAVWIGIAAWFVGHKIHT
jgi:flagellar basal body-associated protein FliL